MTCGTKWFSAGPGLLVWVLAGICLVVPGKAGADIIRMPLLVPVITIYPGDSIKGDILSEKVFRLRRETVGSYARQANAIVGKVARRTLVAGRPIPLNAVEVQALIDEGSRVRIIFRSGGLTINGLGKAVEAGRAGDMIRVQNVDTGAIIHGTVSPDGTVFVEGS